MILAAFRPDTKARLDRGAPGRADGADGVPPQPAERAAPATTTSAAPRIRPPSRATTSTSPAWSASPTRSSADAIPPQVRIRVLEEDLGTEGVDYFGAGPLRAALRHPRRGRPHLALARRPPQHAGLAPRTPRDPNGRPLSFEWRLLQGDPARVTIEPARRRAAARGSPSTGTSPSAISEENPLRTSRGSTSASSPTTACTTAPRRS